MRKRLISSLLKAPMPQVTTLNRKLIIGIAGAVLLVVIAIMVNALTSSNATHNAAESGDVVSGAVASPPDSLSSLPDSYSDAGQINDLLQQRSGGMSAAAKAQLAALQDAQQSLQEQLAAMQQSQQQQQNQNPPPSPMDQQAATSSIFFAGGAPPAQNTAEENADNTKSAGANNGQDKTTQSAGNSYQQQNMQGQKLDFLTSQPNANIYDNNTVQYPASQYILQAGSVIPAILETTLTSNLPGNVIAVVNQDVYDSITGQYLLIPRGSKLIGEYNANVSYGQYQLQAKFTRLIRPDGSSIVLPNSPATDNMGSTGLQDQVDNHWGKIIGAAALSAVFNIPSIIATNQMQASTICPSGSTCTASLGATTGASALQAAGQSASNVGNQLASNSLNLQPTLVINSGKEFSVMVMKDIILPPYTGQ